MTQHGKEIVASMSWVALIAYANRALGLVATLILAKLLSPADFGLVGIASVSIEVLRIFRDMGLSEALIYHKEESAEYLDTAHTILVGFNVVLFALAALAAPVVARFFNNAAVAPVVLVMASNLVWDSARAVPRALYRKRFQFRRLVVPEVVPVMVAAVTSIAMAFAGFGVWSLVVRTVLHSVLGMLLLRRGYQPRFRFNGHAARALFSYGKFVAGTSVLLVILYNIDKFYVGKFAGLAALGMFELAMRISDLPVKEFSFIVGSVMFPVLSQLRDSGEAASALFLRMLKYTAHVSVPAALGLSTYGPPCILSVYGTKWEGMAAPLQILALYAAFRSLSSIVYDAFKAGGQPNLMFRFVVLRLACVAIFGIPAIQRFGLLGICSLLVLTYGLSLVWELKVLTRVMGVTARQCVTALWKPVTFSVALIPSTFWLASRVLGPLTLWQLGFMAALTVGFYMGAVVSFDRMTVTDLMRVLRSMRGKAAAGMVA